MGAGYSKESTVWRLGKISKVGKRNVTVEYYIGDSRSSTLVEQSISDISIVYSVGELMINTKLKLFYQDLFNNLFFNLPLPSLPPTF